MGTAVGDASRMHSEVLGNRMAENADVEATEDACLCCKYFEVHCNARAVAKENCNNSLYCMPRYYDRFQVVHPSLDSSDRAG